MTRDSSVSNSAWQKFTQLLPVKSSDKEKLHNTKITEMSCTGLSKAHVDCITGLAHINSSMLAGAFRRSSLACRTTSQKKIAACSSNRCILDKMNMHWIWFGQCAKKNTCENLIPPFRFRPVQATPRALPRRRRRWSWTEVCLETCRGMSRDVGLGSSPYCDRLSSASWGIGGQFWLPKTQLKRVWICAFLRPSFDVLYRDKAGRLKSMRFFCFFCLR